MTTSHRDPVPSWSRSVAVTVIAAGGPIQAEALAVPVMADGPVPSVLAGVDRDALARAGFTANVGKALAFPSAEQPVRVAKAEIEQIGQQAAPYIEDEVEDEGQTAADGGKLAGNPAEG